MLRAVILLTCVYMISCTGGEPCGGGQYAEARAVLPDSGINAGDTLIVSLHQHDTRELSEFVIWHHWPYLSGVIDPEPDPRVRVVREDGEVLIDETGSRYNQPEDRHNRPTWLVFVWIRDARLRNALYQGFQDQSLWIELWQVGALRPTTRVRLHTERVGVAPTLTCV